MPTRNRHAEIDGGIGRSLGICGNPTGNELRCRGQYRRRARRPSRSVTRLPGFSLLLSPPSPANGAAVDNFAGYTVMDSFRCCLTRRSTRCRYIRALPSRSTLQTYSVTANTFTAYSSYTLRPGTDEGLAGEGGIARRGFHVFADMEVHIQACPGPSVRFGN